MKPITILNLGAGVQSTTIALMGVANWEYWHCSEPLPYEPVGLIDYAIFADTQEEPGTVYRNLEWLKTQCEKFFPVLVRTAGKLGDNLKHGVNANGRRFVSIPAFTAQVEGQTLGIVKRQCTSEYKISVIENCIRRELLGLNPGERAPRETHVEQLYGLSYDEAGRIARVKGNHPWWSEAFFPLFDMEMTRGSCVTWLKKQKIPHEVPRSACVFCPYRSNREWRQLRDTDAQGWQRAVEIDYAIRDHDSTRVRGLNQLLYVHSDCVPLDQVDFDDWETKERKKGQEMFGFLQECDGMCGV